MYDVQIKADYLRDQGKIVEFSAKPIYRWPGKSTIPTDFQYVLVWYNADGTDVHEKDYDVENCRWLGERCYNLGN